MSEPPPFRTSPTRQEPHAAACHVAEKVGYFNDQSLFVDL